MEFTDAPVIPCMYPVLSILLVVYFMETEVKKNILTGRMFF